MALARKQFTVADDAGNIIAGATVTVREETGGAPLASLYSDRDGLSALGNPTTTDSTGFVAFHVAGGAYRIDVTSGAFSRTWRYVGIGTAQESDALSLARTKLTAATTYYVRTDGNDISGDGSANTAAKAFATPQGAYNYIVKNIDGGGFAVTVAIQDGTYTEQTTTVQNVNTGSSEDAVLVLHTQLVGVGSITFQGETEGGAYFQGFGCLHNTQGFVRFANCKFASPAVGGKRGIFSRAPGAVIGIMDGCVFGPFLITDASEVAIQITYQSVCKIFSPITIAGGMHRFLFLEIDSSCDWEDLTGTSPSGPWVTFTGTPSIPYFIQLGSSCTLAMLFLSFSGSFVGTKYVNQGGAIGVYPHMHPNELIPGTIDGLEQGAGNLGIDNNTGVLPSFADTLQLRFGGVSSGTFNVVEANYAEIGPVVYYSITFNLTSKGAQTGAATIGPLPYQAGDFGAVLGWCAPITFANMTAPGAGWGNVTAGIDANATEIGIFNAGTASTGYATLTDANFNNNSSMTITGFYFR